MKKRMISAVLLMCMILTSCGTQEEPINESKTSSVATPNEATQEVVEYTTEEHPEDYYKEIELKHDEKIEYGEVYNSKGIVIKTTNFVNEEKDCYVEVEITNNSGQDLLFVEKSYSENYCNYSGDTLINYEYNDDLYKLSLKNGDTGNAKLEIRDELFNTGYQIVSDIRFLIYASDRETKELIDKIYFQIKTDKDDNIPRYIEYPEIYSDDNFSYQISNIIHSKWDDTTTYLINIYNKTDRWFRIDLTDVYINDILATDEDESFYDVLGVTQSNLNKKADYYTSAKNIFIFPNCKNTCVIVLDDKFKDKNDIETINDVTLNFTYYINDINKYSVQSTGVSFNPEDYK